MKFSIKILAALLLYGSAAQGQIVTDTPPPIADRIRQSAIADLPTGAGKIRQLTNGGSVGAIVVGNGAYVGCIDAFTHRVYVITCPPFNAIGDGTSHPLSERFASLGAAQAVYPFVTGLTQQIDYAAIQLAINTAQGNIPPTYPAGGSVFVPTGAFMIDTMLNHLTFKTSAAGEGFLNSVSLVGAAKHSARIKWNGASGGTMIEITDSNGAWIGGRIENLILDGGGLANYTVHGIGLSGQWRITHNIIGNTLSHGIYLQKNVSGSGALLAEISDNLFGNIGPVGGYGIFTEVCNQCKIYRNEFFDTRGGSVYIYSGDTATIRDNDFEGLTVVATKSITLDSNATPIIDGNRFEDIQGGAQGLNQRSILITDSNLGLGGGTCPYKGTITNNSWATGPGNYKIEFACGSGAGWRISGNKQDGDNIAFIKSVDRDPGAPIYSLFNSGDGKKSVSTPTPGSEYVVQGFDIRHPYGFNRLALGYVAPDTPPAYELAVKGRSIFAGETIAESAHTFTLTGTNSVFYLSINDNAAGHLVTTGYPVPFEKRTLFIKNNSGGALTTGTLSFQADAVKLSSPWTDPAAGQYKIIELIADDYVYNGGFWREVARSDSFAGAVTFGGTVTAPTINATTAYQFGGAALNFSHLAGAAAGTQGGTGQTTSTQGDLLFGAAGNAWSKLAKNASATRYLSNTGTANDPAWAQVDLSNGVTGVLPDANIPNLNTLSTGLTVSRCVETDGTGLLVSAAGLCGTGGSGDNVSVNGVAAADADFDDATPAAPANSINVKWQKDALSPNNVSAYIPYAAPLTVTAGNLTSSFTTSSSDTLTNKTLDAEGTGNVITIPRRIWLPAAGCNGTVAGPIWDLPSASPAVAACITGTNTQKGVLDFADGSNLSAQITYKLPSTWTGAIDANIKWLSATITGDVVWQIATICVADAETDDPAFNTASTVIDTTKGTTNQTNDAAITGVTTTGCAAGELMHVKIFRDSAHASDTMAGTARLIGVELVIREAM